MTRFIGWMLMGVGALIAALSGVCTLGWLGFVVVNLVQQPNAGGLAAAVPLTLVFGGVPIAVGVGLFAFGRSLAKSSDRHDASRDPT